MQRKVVMIAGGLLVSLGVYAILAAEFPLPGSEWLAAHSDPHLSTKFGGKVLVGYSPGLNYSLGPILIVIGVAAFFFAFAWKQDASR